MKTKFILTQALITLFVLSALYQLKTIGDFAGNKIENKIFANRGLDAISRSADSAYGSEFFAYISFLRQKIPEYAVVFDTKSYGLPQYDVYTFLGYFLFPRKVEPLTDERCGGLEDLNTCILQIANPTTYFIYGTNYVPASQILHGLSIYWFSDELGVISP